MLDFTSALYLGLQHASRALRPWEKITTGAPAALAEPAEARTVAKALAALQGCERATLAPSTLHLFWDLFGIASRDGGIIYMDAGIYPIMRWGIERAAARGVPVRSFPHHDSATLRWQLQRDAHRHARPLVVTDGFCPGCGTPAPLAAYVEHTRTYGGQLIVDDTQALGILGSAPRANVPYGKGGGGSLHWSSVSGPDVLVGSSLAKGFGVPVAVLASSEKVIRCFEARGETRVHSSPPSIATIRAAEHALAVNQECGDALRLRLAHRVRHFRRRLVEVGFAARGGLFPVQTLLPIPHCQPAALHERLLRLGVRTVLRRGHNGNGPCLSFLITALHTISAIDHTVRRLERATQRVSAEENFRSEL